jgi:WD40 repeat protein
MNLRLLVWRRRVSRAFGGYDAFLSYRHGADRTRVVAMQRALHRIGKPWWKFRAASVFRDEDGLPLTEAFWPLVEKALRSSRHLVLFASPAIRDSKWVPRELEVWRSIEPRRPLCIVLTDGEMRWDEDASDFDWQASSALPLALKGFCTQEPLWADLRGIAEADLRLTNAAFRAQALKVAAAVHDETPEEMDSDDRRQHRRTMTLAWSVATLLAIALLSVITLLVNVSAEKWRATEAAKQATLARFRETRQTRVAEANARTANEQRVRAEREQARAENEARQALARQLSAQAIAEQNEQPVLAANLGLAAGHLSDTLESRASLLSVVQRHPQVERFIETGLPSGPQDLQLSGDGAYLAVSGFDRPPKLWDLRSGREIGFPTRVETRMPVAMSAERTLCAIPSGDGTVGVWDLHTRRLLHVVRTGLPSPGIVALDAQGRRLVVGGNASTVYDVESGAILAEGIDTSLEGLSRVRLVGEQRMLFESGGLVYVRDLTTKQAIDLPKLEEDVTASDVAPDGTTLALGVEKGRIEIWSLVSAARLATIEGDGLKPAMLRFSRDGSRLVSLSGNAGQSVAERARSTLSMWDVATGKRIGRRIDGLTAPVGSFAVTADLSRVAAIPNRSPVWVWNTAVPHVLAETIEDSEAKDVWRAEVSDDGRIALVQRLGDSGDSVVVADARTGAVRQTLLAPGPQRLIQSLDLSGDGEVAVVSQAHAQFQTPATIRVWRLPGEEPVLAFEDTVASNSVAISSDHRRLAWARDKTTLVVYDVERGRDAFVAELPLRRPLQMRFVDGDRQLLLISTEGFARFDLATRTSRVTRTESLSGHVLSADGRIFAGTRWYREVLAWDTHTGARIGPELTADADVILHDLALNADGSVVAAATSSGSVLLWDRATGRRLGPPLVGHDRAVTDIRLVADGMTMLTREYRGPWVRWRLDPRTLHHRVCARANRNLTPREWAFYVPGQPYHAPCSGDDFAIPAG